MSCTKLQYIRFYSNFNYFVTVICIQDMYTKHSKIPVQYVFISWINNMLTIQFTIILALDFWSHLFDTVLTFTCAIQKGYSSFASSVFEKTRDRMIPSQEFEYFLMTTCAIKVIYVVPFYPYRMEFEYITMSIIKPNWALSPANKVYVKSRSWQRR